MKIWIAKRHVTNEITGRYVKKHGGVSCVKKKCMVENVLAAVSKDRREFLVYKDHKEFKAFPVLKEQQGHKEFKEFQACKDHKGQQVKIAIVLM